MTTIKTERVYPIVSDKDNRERQEQLLKTLAKRPKSAAITARMERIQNQLKSPKKKKASKKKSVKKKADTRPLTACPRCGLTMERSGNLDKCYDCEITMKVQ